MSSPASVPSLLHEAQEALLDVEQFIGKGTGEFYWANFSLFAAGFSTFGFNPKTQQKIKIPAKSVVKFRVGKAAKDAVPGCDRWSGSSST